eukprot:gene29393-41654_t
MELNSHNVHRIVLAALVMAAKLTEDLPFSNVHYADVGGVSTVELQRIEMGFMVDLRFELHVSQQDFAAALVHLRGVPRNQQNRSRMGRRLLGRQGLRPWHRRDAVAAAPRTASALVQSPDCGAGRSLFTPSIHASARGAMPRHAPFAVVRRGGAALSFSVAVGIVLCYHLFLRPPRGG